MGARDVSAEDVWSLDEVLTDASIQGLAVEESYGPDKPVDGFGKLVISLEKRRMHLVNFNLMGGEKLDVRATILEQDFEITELERIDPQKIVMKGTNSWGYPFLASLSTIDGHLDFVLTIEGRGRRQIRNIGSKGLLLKKKHAPGVHLGVGD